MYRLHKKTRKIPGWQYMGQVERWWHRQDRRYGWFWRAANFLLAVLILAGIVIPIAQELVRNNSYRLSADTLKLVGQTDPTLAKQLTYNDQTQTYQFNKDAIKAADSTSPMQAQVGTASGKGSDKSLYALDVPTDPSQGVTYHDINTSLSFSLVPTFKAFPGKTEQGHLVFPLSGDTQAIYTLKNNGLKEDIVLQKASQSAMTFSYKLNLPKTLEAKVIPDSGGAIGVYSADPSLFDNISFGSSKDQAAVEKARENGAKTNLVFGLPAPVVKDTAGKEAGHARFELKGNSLTIVASNLSEAKGPLTIDPSVVITSTSDFQSGNNEDDNIDFGTSGQLTRGGLSGGTLGAWNTEPTLVTKRERNASAAYNGFIYTAGGQSGVNTIETSVEYAPVNSGGTLGAWTKSPNTFANAGNGISLVTYNGYLYVTGGKTNGTFYQNVQYSKINADGSIGAWSDTTALPGPLSGQSMVAYNNHLYVLGGCTATAGAFGGWLCNSLTNSVIVAQISANGSLGSWSNANTGTSFTTGRNQFGATAYNNRMYIMGGCTSTNTNSACATTGNDIQYATINSTTGQLSGWATAANTFATSRSNLGVGVSDGYMYIMGGGPGSGLNYYSDVQYAPIYANGSLGTWTTTTPMTDGLTTDGAIVYKNRAYVIGGCNNTSTNCNSYIGVVSTVTSNPISPAGTTTPWTATTAYPSTTTGPGQTTNAGCIVYNGYIYVAGGYTNKDGAYSNYVEYAPVTATGIGAWASTSSLYEGVGAEGLTAYNGYMYAVGGFDTTTGNPVSTVQYAIINSDGTLGTWASTEPYSSGLGYTTAGHSAVAYNGYLYARGYNSGYSQFVFYAPLSSSNGTVGTWVQAPSLNTQRAFDQMIQVGNHLYDIGGTDQTSTTVATTEYATINANGSLSSWTPGTSMNSPRDKFSAVVYDGYIYALGGEDNTTGLDSSSVDYAPVKSDGSLGTWALNTTLPATIKNSQVAISNNVIYSVSGLVGGSRSLNDYYATINNGGTGTGGTWATLNSFTNTREYLGSVAYNGFLYVLGGYAQTASPPTKYYRNDVQYAPINADGTIGSWAATTSLPTGRYGLSALVYNGYMYMLGGSDGTNVYNDVQYALICTGTNSGQGGCTSTPGTVGTWNTTNSFTTARYLQSAVTHNGYMYVLGGWNKTTYYNDVQYALICTGTNSGQGGCTSTPGTVGTWNTTNSFTTARYSQTSIAYSGYIYVMGGYSGQENNDVQYALICTGTNSGQGGCTSTPGTVGTWNNSTSFNLPRDGASTAVYDGYVYILGGSIGASATQDVEYAPINANGTIGVWKQSTLLTQQTLAPASVAYNGYLYILGGSNQTSKSDYNTVFASPLSSIARTAHYSKLISFGAPVNVTNVALNGSSSGVVSATYQTAGSDGILGASAPVSNISGAGGCYGNTQNTWYIFLMITLDDSYGTGTAGSFPDASGTAANLTDASVVYYTRHPAPNIRLRLGQTLQQGVLGPFDTCSP